MNHSDKAYTRMLEKSHAAETFPSWFMQFGWFQIIGFKTMPYFRLNTQKNLSHHVIKLWSLGYKSVNSDIFVCQITFSYAKKIIYSSE